MDRPVASQIIEDFRSPSFIDALVMEAHKSSDTEISDCTKTIQAEITSLNNTIAKVMDLALKLEDPAPRSTQGK